MELSIRRRANNEESIIDSWSCVPSSANIGPHLPVGHVEASLKAVADEEVGAGDVVRVVVSNAGDDILVLLLHGHRRGDDMAVRVQETPAAQDLVRSPVLRRPLPALCSYGHQVLGTEEERKRKIYDGAT